MIFDYGVYAGGGSSVDVDDAIVVYSSPATQGSNFFNMNYASYFKEIKIGKNIKYCDYMFQTTVSFNGIVKFLGNNVENCSRMFAGCKYFNQPISIPDSVTNCQSMFAECSNFNRPINIPENAVDCYYMFAGCRNFNQPVEIKNNVTNIAMMFRVCNNFNQPINIPKSVINSQYLFSGCNSLNSEITVYCNNVNCHRWFEWVSYVIRPHIVFRGDNANIGGQIFYNCNTNTFQGSIDFGGGYVNCVNLFFTAADVYSGASVNLSASHHQRAFNNRINFSNGIYNCINMFKSCNLFNQPINMLEGTLNNGSGMFAGCNNLNSRIEIGSAVEGCDCSLMFQGCTNLNSTIILPRKNITRCASMFISCPNFNQPISIPESAVYCSEMFLYDYKFNQPVSIPDSVIDCYRMFGHCNLFNQQMVFPNKINNFSSVFESCDAMFSNVYINNKSVTNVKNMFATTSYLSPRRIFCNNLSKFLETSASYSIVGRAITWTAITNGYYNATYNIYLYNNYVGT